MAKIIGALIYYSVVLPLAYLPTGISYIFARFFFVLTFIFPYRQKVILRNMRASFPEKTEKEIQQLKRQFYSHFTDIFVEGLKNLTISKKRLMNHFRIANPELMDELYLKNRSVLLVAGHYNNWEWMISSLDMHFPHKAIGIGQPLTAKFWDKKVNQRRSRFGMHVVHSKNFRAVLETYKQPVSVLMLSDQSPPDSRKSYWMNFLNQETAVLFGVEQVAHAMHAAVVYFETEKVKRGHYLVHLKLITDQADKLEWGQITEAHTKELEKTILKNPAFWLWSHKRWKRVVPKDLIELKKEQKNAFNQRFKHSK